MGILETLLEAVRALVEGILGAVADFLRGLFGGESEGE
jgi:hypothetical protein